MLKVYFILLNFFFLSTVNRPLSTKLPKINLRRWIAIPGWRWRRRRGLPRNRKLRAESPVLPPVAAGVSARQLAREQAALRSPHFRPPASTSDLLPLRSPESRIASLNRLKFTWKIKVEVRFWKNFWVSRGFYLVFNANLILFIETKHGIFFTILRYFT